MTGYKKLVGVTLAVILVAAAAAFVLRPNAGPNTSAVIDEPEVNDPGTGPGTDPAVDDPPKPERLSKGPNHQVCVPYNEHIPEHAWVRGANWYRFYEFAACAATVLAALVIY
jgi:hypothetical protein